ncbi:sperm-associated antigen 1 [Polyodon spathula]|uniref:sperm-associated antigen 1 n=1 Tax=Polyodon spathula TaxID=7913 RepID=UPI001B7F5E6C|nr:sperm-associated antigen 1 [Polyodon spathula]
METEQVSSMLDLGTTKSYKIPVEHLDYSFIEKCTDVHHLEKILLVLRSGEEGIYPALTEFCEKKIESLDPRSHALRKEKPPATATSFSSEEWKEIMCDLKSWSKEINQIETELKLRSVLDNSENVPPVRGSNVFVPSKQNKINKGKTSQNKVVPREYSEWDKFDVEQECAKVEGCNKEKSSPRLISHGLPKIKRKIDTTDLTDKEKNIIANREKDKGNEFFYAKDYEDAVVYYTRSISVIPSVAAYNNRAQAEIKLQHWNNAFNDCEKVLELEPNNMKALLRRATVYKHLGKVKEAADDLKKVLQAEPENVMAKKLLHETKEKRDMQSKKQPKGKRILIQEVEDLDEETETESCLLVGGESAAEKGEMGNAQRKFPGRGDGGPQTEEKPPSTAKKAQAKRGSSEKNSYQGAKEQGQTNEFQRNGSNAGDQTSPSSSGTDSSRPDVPVDSGALPPDIARLKSQGNELFKSGQFSEALLKYTQAINDFTEAEIDSPGDLSILYSNRAACFLKDGNCNDCIQDSTRALELQPFSVKPLLRRAMAYESLERYQQAYVDYKTVLQIDSGIQSANDSVNRITRLLIDQDGHNWREKLPDIPAVPLSALQNRWEGTSANCEQTQQKNKGSGGSKPVQDTGKKTEALFLSLKQEGNDFVQKGQYKDALGKYTECLKLKSSECAIYTNRALCNLKLNQFEEAKQDCDSALQLEPFNMKAFYRRAMAHKGLKNYAYCMDDLKEVLRLDPNVTEAEKELQEAAELLSKQSVAPDSQEKQRKKIQIQEVNDSDEEETENRQDRNDGKEVNCHVGTGDNQINHCGSENMFPLQPTNAYEFGQALNAVKSKEDVAACAKLLCSVEPENLPSLMSNKLEVDSFTIIIQALDNHLLQKDPKLVYRHLVHLHEAERFKMVSLLLGKTEREQVKQLFDHLSTVENAHFTSDDVENLAKHYLF